MWQRKGCSIKANPYGSRLLLGSGQELLYQQAAYLCKCLNAWIYAPGT